MSYKILFAFLALSSIAFAGEKLIFEDNFDKLDFRTWAHEQTLSGGGNWEFEWYVQNRSNSFVRDGVLYLKPTLTNDYIGDDGLYTSTQSIWGGSPADLCTSNAFYGCERSALGGGTVINPVRSARLRTAESFSFKYGRVEISAKMPRGDWLWPAIWMLPRDLEYGLWPASGEIDILESRGNDESYGASGVDKFASTLHWGPNWDMNRYELTHAEYAHSEGLDKEFHTYGLYWDENGLYTYFDDESQKVLQVDFTEESFYERGGYSSMNLDNPWVGESNAAPFNREFYLILNVAVGGTNGYFPDGFGGKPWSDTSPTASTDFWGQKDNWYSTWNGDAVAMQIDSIKVWSFDDSTETTQ